FGVLRPAAGRGDAEISWAVLSVAGRPGHGSCAGLRGFADGARLAALQPTNGGNGDFRRIDGRDAVAGLWAARHRLCGSASLFQRDAWRWLARSALKGNPSSGAWAHSGVTRVTWPILRPARISLLP